MIPTCHRNESLAECLDRLAPGAQTLESNAYEVIVSDDGARSSARPMLEQKYPWAKWTQGPRRGPAANRNHGARDAQGDWIAFTDDDCLPDRNWLEALATAIRAGKALVLEGKTSPTGVRLRIDMDCPTNEAGGQLWSCNMAIQKQLFLDLDGFDPWFPGPAMEDVDLRIRLGKAGRKFEFVPTAVVLHPWRLKRGFHFCRSTNRAIRYFITKHPETAAMVSTQSLVLDAGRRLFKQLPPAALAYRGRGLGREVALVLYSFLISLREFTFGKPPRGSSSQGEATL